MCGGGERERETERERDRESEHGSSSIVREKFTDIKDLSALLSENKDILLHK